MINACFASDIILPVQKVSTFSIGPPKSSLEFNDYIGLVNRRPPEFFSAALQKALDRSDPTLSFQLSGVPTTSFVYILGLYVSRHLFAFKQLECTYGVEHLQQFCIWGLHSYNLLKLSK